MLSLGAQNNGCMKEIQVLIQCCRYDIMVLPPISSYTELHHYVTQLGIPILVSLELFPTATYRRVISISPYMSFETSQVEYHIIDGSHPEMKAIEFNEEGIDWCCGNELCFNKITDGFAFVPGKERAFKMLCQKSGYNLVLGTVVCLTNSLKQGRGVRNIP